MLRRSNSISNTMNERTVGAILLLPTGSISGSVRFMCLRTLKPIVRTQWTVLPIPEVLVSFINKLVKLVSQDPVFTRGDPDVQETVISDDGEEPLGMPEDMEGADRAPGRVQPMPEDVVGDKLRRAFSTPYSGDDPEYDSEDADENTEVYEAEEQVPDQEYEPEVEEKPHVHVPEPEVPVSAPVEVAPAVWTSVRVRNPARYCISL